MYQLTGEATAENMTETVLIVEDQSGLAAAYSSALEPTYEIRTAHSGSEALDRVDDAVDVVLLDRRMPGMSGDELVAELADRDFSFSVAMLTAVDPDDAIIEMAIDAYVTKPISNDELLALVDDMVELQQYEGAVRQYLRNAVKKQALEKLKKHESQVYETLLHRLEKQESEIEDPVEKKYQKLNRSWLD